MDSICHFPLLCRLYLTSTGYVDQEDYSLSAPLTQHRLENGPKRSNAPFNPKSLYFPSKLLSPLGKVIITSDSAPQYTVISYTWGRWKIDNPSHSTRMEGCYWDIPSTTQFTRQDLDLAVANIASGRHVWLDVFCIPQNASDPEMEREINRQGDIFANASAAAVWLCSGGESTLREICSWTKEYYTYEVLDFAPARVDAEGKCHFRPATRKRLECLARLRDDVPWTTSLWTLQESALRRDAVFYDKQGHAVRSVQSGDTLTVDDLVKTLGQIESELEGSKQYVRRLTAPDDVLYQSAISTVRGVSLGKLDSMNAGELFNASQQRISKWRHDRVYGIMNALGVSMPVDYTGNADDVFTAFTLALHNKYPAEMQAFLQFDAPPSEPSWRQGRNASSLSQIRQCSSTSARFPQARFTDIDACGRLVADAAALVDEDLVEKVSELIRRGFATVCFDERGASRVLPSGWEKQQDVVAQNLRMIAERYRMLLIPLGLAQATIHVGEAAVYMIVIDRNDVIDYSGSSVVTFRRAGLLFVAAGNTSLASVLSPGSYYIS